MSLQRLTFSFGTNNEFDSPTMEADISSSQVCNRKSVQIIYQKYALPIYSLALRMTSDATDAEDITQEVLLQVIRRLDTFRGESSFTTWLYRVTVNAVLALRRKRATAKERQFGGPEGDEGPDGLVAARAGLSAAPEDEVLGGELREHLEAAIARLPDTYRDPFILSDIEHFSNAEICDLLGLSLAAVKSRLHRARWMLRTALQPYMAERCETV